MRQKNKCLAQALIHLPQDDGGEKDQLPKRHYVERGTVSRPKGWAQNTNALISECSARVEPENLAPGKIWR